MIDKKQYSLLAHNTFGIHAMAARFVEYSSVDELCSFISSGELKKPYLHIGQGSNLLFTHDYEGIILHSCIKGIQVLNENDSEVLVRVGAGEIWDEWVAYCVAHGWYGLENLSLIPGEVGAGAVQNIGAYGAEFKDMVECVETLNIKGENHIYRNPQCEYTYRNSLFKRPEMKDTFVTFVQFRLSKKENYKLDYGSIRQELDKFPKLNLESVRQVVISIRQNKLPDPKVTGNAGSFFMNPIISRIQFEALLKEYPAMPFYEIDEDKVKIPAGWMIDQCGWKGKSLGPVAVHNKQALVLINLGGATGADVIALSNAVRVSVANKFGIEIHPEVNFI
jgi:UDP-N-acetylmuramate dehydrogenase